MNEDLCDCKSKSEKESTNVLVEIKKETVCLENEKIVWERDFRVRTKKCPICGKIRILISKYLLRDNIYQKTNSINLPELSSGIKDLLMLFQKQQTITTRKVMSILRGNYLTVLTDLWERGIIVIHRKKQNTKIVIPSEIGEKIPEWLERSILREGFKIHKISLTKRGRTFLKTHLEWDRETKIIDRTKFFIEEFIKKNTTPLSSDQRLAFLYEYLKNILKQVENGDSNVFYDKKGQEKVRFNPKSDYFVLTVRLLIEMYVAINNSRILYPPSVAKKFDVSVKKIRYIRTHLEQILKVSPIYFNFLRSDLPTEKNPLNIPMEVQDALDLFEIHLRDFLIKKLLQIAIAPIDNYFPPDILEELRKHAISEMKMSQKDRRYIQQFKNSNLLNEKDLIWIFEQMTNKDYTEFITHNFSFLREYFADINYKNHLRGLIAPLRNVKAHIKTKAERDISKHLGILYLYEKIFKESS